MPPKDRGLWNKDEVVVGSRDRKAAGAQTIWPRALSPEELFSPKSYHDPRPAWKKMPQCMLPAQAKLRTPSLSGPGGEGKVKIQSSGTACSFPILMLCRNNQELQEHWPARLAWLATGLLSLFPHSPTPVEDLVLIYSFLQVSPSKGSAKRWTSA